MFEFCRRETKKEKERERERVCVRARVCTCVGAYKVVTFFFHICMIPNETFHTEKREKYIRIEFVNAAF